MFFKKFKFLYQIYFRTIFNYQILKEIHQLNLITKHRINYVVVKFKMLFLPRQILRCNKELIYIFENNIQYRCHQIP